MDLIFIEYIDIDGSLFWETKSHHGLIDIQRVNIKQSIEWDIPVLLTQSCHKKWAYILHLPRLKTTNE